MTTVAAKTTPPASTPPGGHAGGGFAGKVKRNPQLAVGAGAVAVVVVLAMMSKNNTAANPATDPASVAAAQGAGYDSSANDVYNSLAGQMQTLQDQIDAQGATTSTPLPDPLGTTPGGTDTTVPAALTPAPAPAAAPQSVIYQGADGVINHVAAAVQSTPYANGQLLYTDAARPWLGTIQTMDTAANRAEIARSGGVLAGGY